MSALEVFWRLFPDQDFVTAVGGSIMLLKGDGQMRHARFTDERPTRGADAGPAGPGGDGGRAGDPVPASGGAADTLIASGTFEGRHGEQGRGDVRLWRRAAGGFALELGTDFAASAVPGPVVVLSTRTDLGIEINPALGDLEVGALPAPSGAQVISFAAPPETRRYAWVFCKPFGLEIARAALRDAP